MRNTKPKDFWTTCLQALLRFGAAVMGLAILAVFMPMEWMQASNSALGLEPMADTPLMQYLTRSLSLIYAAYGSLMWVTSSDLRRFSPVITYMAVAGIIISIFLFGIDRFAGLPLWWALGEAAVPLSMGGAVLFLQSRIRRQAVELS